MDTMELILGIDYGSRRIGIALADAETRIAIPHDIIMGRNDPTRDAVTIIEIAKRKQAATLVVGLPLNMDGTESDQTRWTQRFVGELKRLSSLSVQVQDERLSSFEAEELLNAGAIKGRKQKARLDAVAAQRILQSFLDKPI